MLPKNRTSLLLESLEDRFAPALTYTLDGMGDLSVTGNTANAMVTVTSAGTAVTVVDGLSSHTFAVTANLTFNITLTNAAPVFYYHPGATAAGAVSLNLTSIFNETVVAAGTGGGQNVNGPLTINTPGVGNDSVNIYNLNPAGINVNNGGGNDTVTVGYTNPFVAPPAAAGGAASGPVLVRGNVQGTNVNTFALGLPMAGPAVTVQGFASISTHNSAGITAANPNVIDLEPEATVQGNLIATLNGPFESFSTQGATGGSAIVQLGAGTDFVFFQDPSTEIGSVTISAAAGASTFGDVNGIVGGNVGIYLGNGGNTFATHMTMGGTFFSYHGGSGNDSFDFGTGTNAANAVVQLIFGSGDDTFTLDSSAYKILYADGGFGFNVFNANVPIGSTATIKNF